MTTFHLILMVISLIALTRSTQGRYKLPLLTTFIWTLGLFLVLLLILTGWIVLLPRLFQLESTNVTSWIVALVFSVSAVGILWCFDQIIRKIYDIS